MQTEQSDRNESPKLKEIAEQNSKAIQALREILNKLEAVTLIQVLHERNPDRE